MLISSKRPMVEDFILMYSFYSVEVKVEEDLYCTLIFISKRFKVVLAIYYFPIVPPALKIVDNPTNLFVLVINSITIILQLIIKKQKVKVDY